MSSTTGFTVLIKIFVIFFNRNALKWRCKLAVFKLGYAWPGDTNNFLHDVWAWTVFKTINFQINFLKEEKP